MKVMNTHKRRADSAAEDSQQGALYQNAEPIERNSLLRLEKSETITLDLHEDYRARKNLVDYFGPKGRKSKFSHIILGGDLSISLYSQITQNDHSTFKPYLRILLQKMFENENHVDEERQKKFLKDMYNSKNELRNLIPNPNFQNGTDKPNQNQRTWNCILFESDRIEHIRIGIFRTQKRDNLLVLIVGPKKAKGKLNCGRKMAEATSIFLSSGTGMMRESDDSFGKLMEAENEQEFRSVFLDIRKLNNTALHINNGHQNGHHGNMHGDHGHDTKNKHISHAVPFPTNKIGQGILQDIKNRLPFYYSDWYDTFFIKNSSGKLTFSYSKSIKFIRATNFVIISVLLPTLAFGHANYENTDKRMTVERGIFGQCLAGVIFALFSSQPLGLVMQTPPITLIIYFIAKISGELDFFQFYALTGVCIGLNLVLYSLLNLSCYLKHITPSIEQIFALFTSCAFLKEVYKSLSIISDKTKGGFNLGDAELYCWEIIVVSTAGLALFLTTFLKKSKYINQYTREMLSSYSLLISVITFTAQV